jgi:hypothetical protein
MTVMTLSCPTLTLPAGNVYTAFVCSELKLEVVLIKCELMNTDAAKAGKQNEP